MPSTATNSAEPWRVQGCGRRAGSRGRYSRCLSRRSKLITKITGSYSHISIESLRSIDSRISEDVTVSGAGENFCAQATFADITVRQHYPAGEIQKGSCVY